MKALLVFVTIPPDVSLKIAERIVEEKLAACVNIYPVNSIYFWKGKIEKDSEHLLLIKTRKDLFDSLKERIVELHTYEVPEIVGIPVEEGYEPYLKWIFDSTAKSG